jgi:hypothetical protein
MTVEAALVDAKHPSEKAVNAPTVRANGGAVGEARVHAKR